MFYAVQQEGAGETFRDGSDLQLVLIATVSRSYRHRVPEMLEEDFGSGNETVGEAFRHLASLRRLVPCICNATNKSAPT